MIKFNPNINGLKPRDKSSLKEHLYNATIYIIEIISQLVKYLLTQQSESCDCFSHILISDCMMKNLNVDTGHVELVTTEILVTTVNFESKVENSALFWNFENHMIDPLLYK